MRRESVVRVAVIACAIGLAACEGLPATQQPTATQRPAATARASSQSPMPAAPPLDSAPVTYDDAAGDLADLDGNPVSGPDFIDIAGIDASVTSAVLEVTLRVNGTTPPLDGSVEQINYLLAIDTSGDDRNFDYWLSLENRSDSEYHPALDDWGVGYHYDDDEYPGDVVLADGAITWSVPLSALGNPETIRVWAWTQRSLDFDVVAEDFLPDKFPDRYNYLIVR